MTTETAPVMLYKRALVLAKTEAAFNVDSSPTPASDSFLVEDPMFDPDIAMIERTVVLPSLSHLAPIAGRKLGKVTFGHEVKSNGNTLGTVEPRLGRLLRACGMQATQINTAALTLEQELPNTGNLGNISWVVSTAYAQAVRRTVFIEVVNVSPIRVRVFGDEEGILPAFDTGTADITITNNVAFSVHDNLGNLVVGLTPEVGSAGVHLGDVYQMNFRPLGWAYKPQTDLMDSITLYLYYPDDSGQSLLHKLTGARGNVQLDAQGGSFGKLTFTFTGSYQTVTDVSFPGTQAVYETTKPPQVELANLIVTQNNVDAADLYVAKFTFEPGNDVKPREDVNNPNSYAGVLIVDRKPVIGFDPEAAMESRFPFWGNIQTAAPLAFRASIGTVQGNIFSLFAENISETALKYQNRQSVRAYEVKATCSAVSFYGNDEWEIYFS